MALAPSTRLGPYEILSVAGAGGIRRRANLRHPLPAEERRTSPPGRHLLSPRQRAAPQLDPRCGDTPIRLHRAQRALLFPGYKETYSRRLPPGDRGPNAARDVTIMWTKDVGRSIDFLRSRPDIDGERIGYYGLSMGAVEGPVVGAVDRRIRTLVLVGGGLSSGQRPPEVDTFNFAPRVTAPVLMVNGSHDFLFPLEASQEPLFRLLATPEDAKRHVVYEGGHVPSRLQDIARETLDWLDRYLGPVVPKAGP